LFLLSYSEVKATAELDIYSLTALPHVLPICLLMLMKSDSHNLTYVSTNGPDLRFLNSDISNSNET